MNTVAHYRLTTEAALKFRKRLKKDKFIEDLPGVFTRVKGPYVTTVTVESCPELDEFANEVKARRKRR